MSLNLNLDGVDTQESDKVGGGSYSLPTDVYDAEISLVHLINSASSKSAGVDITLKINGTEKSFPIYYTNKNGEPFYLDKNKKKKALPGLLMLSSLTQFIVNKTFDKLTDNDFSKKTVKLWDNSAKTEIPKEVTVIPALHGKKIKVAIEEIEQNNYNDPSKTVKKNNLIKFFDEKGHTFSESKSLKNDPNFKPHFLDAWLEANKGKIVNKVDKTKVKATSTGSKPITELNLDDEEL